MLFEELRARFHGHWLTIQQYPLFTVAVDKEDIWQRYLAGFAPEDRQEHTCNACRHFLQQYGGIVALTETLARISLWDFPVEDLRYAASIEALAAYVHSRPLANIVAVKEARCGVERNRDSVRGIVWQHFALTLPPSYVTTDVDARQGVYRGNVEVFQRALEELTLEASMTVLDLIEQNVLYRGTQFQKNVTGFWQLQQQYAATPADVREAFVWRHAGTPVAHIRNSAIGTLLVDISGGMDVEAAVARYERVVAPSNYQRPTALITARMITEAQKTIEDLGLREALDRRYARGTDLPIDEILFKHTPRASQDIFAALHQDVVVDPRALRDAPELAIEHFLAEIVPQASQIELLLEQRHRPHLVTLLTAEHDDAPLLFPWDNPFSWSYTGQVTDSIKERVKQAGGNVSGVLRISLAWHNHDDLDLHVIEPSGHHIYYGDKRHSATTGHLDVDMNVMTVVGNPVENIVWTQQGLMQTGTYCIYVSQFNKRQTVNQGFTVEIEYEGQLWTFEHQANIRTDVTKLTFANDGLTVHGNPRTGIDSREMWGLHTNRFQTVTHAMLSPNQWGTQRYGNKHFLFLLHGCVCDEAPRPFYNEFLAPTLHVHRKVFEVMGSKLVVSPSPAQLSGLGFSETQHARIAVRVSMEKTQRTFTLVF